MYRIWDFITTYSVLLIGGAVIALFWANTAPESYQAFVNYPLWYNDWFGKVKLDAAGNEIKVMTLRYMVNDALMAMFFAIAAKEVWEAVILKNGSLRGRKAATPLVATAGGMFGPISVYLGLAWLMGSDTYNAVVNGWAIPTATDIAFSYLIARVVFGAGHPAVRFLLLLAIADDAAGLMILAIFYPSGELAPAWLLLSAGSALGAFVLFNWLPRKLDRGNQLRPRSTWVRRRLSFWPYAFAGVLSWIGFLNAGLHPALGLLPVVPAIPHADRAFGIFAAAEEHLSDLLNRMEHALKIPVEIVLFFFGLANAGVMFTSIGDATYLVLLGLIVGKPVGILLFGWIAAGPMNLGMPEGMRVSHLFVIGCIAAIGFTVSLFIASVAFEPGLVQDAAKMGALMSFGAAAMAIIAGKLLGVEKRPG